ncbi:sugar ABC transporter substrate-binding protein [Dactylosporangium sp. NPDC000244]|uniref:sugar ABC transporter substrate-binding protein n=1 Tax=Dactylosporangium sp. NPDC000244 TaxID=3154365 RepID=UPI003328FB62
MNHFTGRLLPAIAVATATILSACSSGGSKPGTDDAINSTVTQSGADKILDEIHAGPPTACTSGKGLTLGFAAVWSSNAAGKASSDAFNAAAKACGATPLVVEAKADDPLNTMISAMDLITSKKADAVTFYPLTADVMTAPSKRAAAAGIPVVAGEMTNLTGAATTFHQDRLTAAVNAAKLFCAKYPDGGEVIYGAYGQPQQDLLDMQKRFTQELASCSANKLKVVATYQNQTDDIAGGLSTAQAAMQQHPKVIGVAAYNDTDAVAASRAASNLGIRDRLTIVGYNVDAVGLDALQKGTIDYSFLWGQPEQLQETVNVMIALATGQKAPKYITLYPKCVSKKTVARVPSVAVRTVGIAEGRDMSKTGLQPMLRSDDTPVLEVPDDVRGSVACPVEG